MAVPLLDLRAQYQTIREPVMRVTAEIFESQAFILGPRVEAFEVDFAAYCGARHCVGVSSGTDALLLALMVHGLGPGHEVIVPAYSFFATAGVVERLGARPVFVDITLDDYNIDPGLIEERITAHTRAIMPVHLYGQVAAMDEITAIAGRHGLLVVEDAAQAVGAGYGEHRAGVLAHAGCFSFFPSKNLGAFGDAGAITVKDDTVYEKLKDYRVHGMRPKYHHRYVGGNFRIDALQAAVLSVKMPHLDAWAEGRRRNAAFYEELFSEAGLAERVVLPRELPGRHHVYNQYVVRFAEGQSVRDKVMHHLRSVNIGCEIYYPLTLPQQECFRSNPCSAERYTQAEAAAAQSLAIPVYAELSRDQLDEVVREIARGLAA